MSSATEGQVTTYELLLTIEAAGALLGITEFGCAQSHATGRWRRTESTPHASGRKPMDTRDLGRLYRSVTSGPRPRAARLLGSSKGRGGRDVRNAPRQGCCGLQAPGEDLRYSIRFCFSAVYSLRQSRTRNRWQSPCVIERGLAGPCESDERPLTESPIDTAVQIEGAQGAYSPSIGSNVATCSPPGSSSVTT